MILRIAAVALGLLATASTAFAHSDGTVFSSPVDGDGAALFWNPAAMAASPTSRFDLVANLSVVTADYQRSGVDQAQGGRPYPAVSLTAVRPEPHVGLVIDKLWHRRLRIGFDFTVPIAAGAAWPTVVNDGTAQVLGPTRYHVTDANTFAALFQLGASIVLHPTFAIGASVNIALSHLDFTKHVDLANQGIVRDALPCAQNPLGCESPALSTPLHLVGNGVSAGGTIGVMWQPIQRLRFGLSYLSPIKVPVGLQISADAGKLSDFARQFVPGFTTLAINGSGEAFITIPMRVHAAVAFDVHPRIELMAFLTWINNSATEIITGTITSKTSTLVPDTLAIPSVKNDTWIATVRVVGRVRERWKLGLSVEYFSNGVPDAYMTPSNLDWNSVVFNLGANVRLTPIVFLGASFSHAVVITRTITGSAFGNARPEPYNLPDPSGTYAATLDRVGLDLTTKF